MTHADQPAAARPQRDAVCNEPTPVPGPGVEIGERDRFVEIDPSASRGVDVQQAPGCGAAGINLPDGNGISFAADLPPTPGTPPRVLLTSSDRTAAPDRLLSRAHVAGFIPKTELIAADLRPHLG